MKSLLILGAGGHGQVVKEIAEDLGYEKIDFLDDNSSLAIGKIGEIPGKVQTYMAAGKPIIGAIDGEARNIINDAKCGLSGSAGDVAGLVINMSSFLKLNRIKLGRNSRKYYEQNFTKEMFIISFINLLKS